SEGVAGPSERSERALDEPSERSEQSGEARQPYPLAARIASGDADATRAFVAEHAGSVRVYCAAVAGSDEVDDAVAAAFAGFAEAVARAPGAADSRLDAGLLAATRPAAARHTHVTPRRGPIPQFLPKLLGRKVEPSPGPCARVPELLAARANGPLPTNVAARLD